MPISMTFRFEKKMKLIISLALSQIMGILAIATIPPNDPTLKILIVLLFVNLIVCTSAVVYSYLKQS